MQIFMQCGHTASSVDGNNNPICGLCNGLSNGYDQVIHHKWEGRLAQCVYCDNETESHVELPYFSYRANESYDSYYCGCKDGF